MQYRTCNKYVNNNNNNNNKSSRTEYRGIKKNNNNNRDDIYGAVIMEKPFQEFTRFIWSMQTKRRLADNPQTKPIDLKCESAGNGSYHRIHHHHLLLLRTKADTHFTIPRRVEGWVDLAT